MTGRATALSAGVTKRVQRRAHPRKNANFIGIVMLGGYAIPCSIVNLSISGAYVRLHKPIDLPRKLATLTCAHFGRTSAEVVWQNGMDVTLKFGSTLAPGRPKI
jgi:hypothetical protein